MEILTDVLEYRSDIDGDDDGFTMPTDDEETDGDELEDDEADDDDKDDENEDGIME